jgi:hypothetical protein
MFRRRLVSYTVLPPPRICGIAWELHCLNESSAAHHRPELWAKQVLTSRPELWPVYSEQVYSTEPLDVIMFEHRNRQDSFGLFGPLGHGKDHGVLFSAPHLMQIRWKRTHVGRLVVFMFFVRSAESAKRIYYIPIYWSATLIPLYDYIICTCIYQHCNYTYHLWSMPIYMHVHIDAYVLCILRTCKLSLSLRVVRWSQLRYVNTHARLFCLNMSVEMAWSGLKWLEMFWSGLKWLEMVWNGLKWFE